MKRIEAGVHETEDGRYQIERITAVGEWNDEETLWVLNQHRHGIWEEIGEATTKRELVARIKAK